MSNRSQSAVTRLAVVALLVSGWSACDQSRERPEANSRLGWVKIDDASLRRIATFRPPPKYPDASLQRGASGVAVAQVFISADGRMKAVEVLEAPDADVQAAVREALMQWEFEPVLVSGSTKKMEVEGLMAFYFKVVDGTGVVMGPEEMSSARPSISTTTATIDSYTVARLGKADFSRLTDAFLLDVRDRRLFGSGHLSGAINVPIEELAARAKAEVPVSNYVVIDCEALAISQCEGAGNLLKRLGYGRVALLEPRN